MEYKGPTIHHLHCPYCYMGIKVPMGIVKSDVEFDGAELYDLVEHIDCKVSDFAVSEIVDECDSDCLAFPHGVGPLALIKYEVLDDEGEIDDEGRICLIITF